jgi:hypothetical protein
MPAIVNKDSKVWGSLLKEILKKDEKFIVLSATVILEKIEYRMFNHEEREEDYKAFNKK